MKRPGIYQLLATFLALFLVAAAAPQVQAKKAKLRLSVQYVKTMDESAVIKVTAKAKGEDGMQTVSDVELSVYREFEDTSFFITKITTDADGIAVFDVMSDPTTYTDTMKETSYRLKAKAGEWYKGASKTVSYIDSKLETRLETIDSTVYIIATLTNARTGEPVAEEGLKVRVRRMFTPLTIGKAYYYTDEEGSIQVPYEDDIPGKNKELVFEILLQESDLYGTVIDVLPTNLGKPVILESTFDERTMWSPPNKTPLWLLIFPNLIIFGIWFTILRLVYNLFRISKA